MGQTEFEKLLLKTPKDVKKFIDLSFDIVDEVDGELKKQGKTRSDLATLLDKNESEISKILSGIHNPTLKSVCKISAVLDMNILSTPSKEAEKYQALIQELEKKIQLLNKKLNKQEKNIKPLTFVKGRASKLQFKSKLQFNCNQFTIIRSNTMERGVWEVSENDIVKPQDFASFSFEKSKKSKRKTLA